MKLSGSLALHLSLLLEPQGMREAYGGDGGEEREGYGASSLARLSSQASSWQASSIDKPLQRCPPNCPALIC